jgi:opacity protein-like surface antigen
MRPVPSSPAHWLSVALALGASLCCSRAQIPWATEFFPRQNKFEAYGIAQYLHQNDTTYPGLYGNNVKMTMDDTGLGGFGMAYHFNDFFSIHGDFMFGPATFHAEGPGGIPIPLGQDGFLQTGRVNLDYNIINRRLTPFITAGIGYQYLQVDQNTPYNRYYYYYDYYDNYYSESDFTWNVGAGLRWNITDNLFIKVSGGAQWLQYQDAQDVTTQIEAFFTIGWTFP